MRGTLMVSVPTGRSITVMSESGMAPCAGAGVGAIFFLLIASLLVGGGGYGPSPRRGWHRPRALCFSGQRFFAPSQPQGFDRLSGLREAIDPLVEADQPVVGLSPFLLKPVCQLPQRQPELRGGERLEIRHGLRGVERVRVLDLLDDVARAVIQRPH